MMEAYCHPECQPGERETCCSTLSPSLSTPPLPIQARYCMMSFAVSVFPAPLSPLTCTRSVQGKVSRFPD